MEATIDWSMGSRAAALIDWGTATQTGRRVGGSGPPTPAVERARMREDLAEVVPYAETLIGEFTGLSTAGGFRSRAWLMSRGEWVNANVNGLQRLLEPLAARVLPEGAPRSDLRRKALGAQIGALLGYVSRKVLGQYDAFLPPDDDGVLYFVGPNLVEIERRFELPRRDFRLWVAIHEVTHRVQFGATPWLRPHLEGLIGRYLETVQVDSREVLSQLRRAAEAIRSGADWRGMNGILLIMNDEQRALFSRMQALMTAARRSCDVRDERRRRGPGGRSRSHAQRPPRPRDALAAGSRRCSSRRSGSRRRSSSTRPESGSSAASSPRRAWTV